MASDQTPIEKAMEVLELFGFGDLDIDEVQRRAKQQGLAGIEAREELKRRDAIAGLRAHVEAQRPDKVLTDEGIERISGEWQERIPDRDRVDRAVFEQGLRYARDNGYLAPAQPPTLDKIMEVVKEWSTHDRVHSFEGEELATFWAFDKLRERLNKLIG